MRASRCRRCQALAYPAHRLCRACRHDAFQEVSLGEGTLLTYTVLHVPPPGVPAPLTLGIAEFEGGVKALGQVVGEAAVGLRVEGEWAPLRTVDGQTLEGFRFRPVEGRKG